MIQANQIKEQFPLLSNQPDLVYLDNAATTQRPQSVIDALQYYYQNQNANIHRGLYPLSAQSTQRYEAVRVQTAAFIGAASASCIAFTAGTTASINIIANGFLKQQLQAGDNIVISALEHHANLIPWQILAAAQQATLRIIPVDSQGNLLLEQLPQLLDERTRLLAFTAISNSIGTVNPIKEIVALAKVRQIPVLIDGAQSTGVYPLDVEELDVDFYTFSAHKMFGPFGVGVLYAHPRHHREINPIQYGGGMIQKVCFEQTSFLPFPKNQEGGTPNIAGVIGFGAAIDFCENLDQVVASEYEKDLSTYARLTLKDIEGLQLVGEPENYGGIVSFVVEGVHPHDLAQFLAEAGIAVRAGHHCTQPLLDLLGVSATVRISFSIYNNRAEVDYLVQSLKEIKQFWT